MSTQTTQTATATTPKEETRQCEYCRGTFKLHPWDRGKIFCSNHCRRMDDKQGPGQ